MKKGCQIAGPHCEQCGSAKPEDLAGLQTDGLSHCCVELISYDSSGCRGFHCRKDASAALRKTARRIQKDQVTSTPRRRFGVDFLFAEDGKLVERADGKAVARKQTKGDGYADEEVGWVVTYHSDWDYYTEPFSQRREAVEYMATEPEIEKAVNINRRSIKAVA